MLSRRHLFAASTLLASLVLGACGSDGDSTSATQAPGTQAPGTVAPGDSTAPGTDPTGTQPAATDPVSTDPVTLRLGYFPNITHAPALVGVQDGIFEDALADNVTLKTSTFNAGPEAIEALFADAIDATFIGPNPAINAYVKSKGDALRIVSGSTSGGAFLVVKPEINGPADLKGKKLASPQLGGTQDVALRSWLKDNGLETDTSGGGDVSIVPQENGATLDAFKAGEIDGAWLPEPWATRLIQEGGAKVLVDERDLWPDGKFVTTHLIVSKSFLDQHPDVVKQLIAGEIDTIDFIAANPAEAQTAANDQIESITQKRLKDEVISAAWENLTFTWDPVASSLITSADRATSVGLLDKVDLNGIYDLTLLNEVLTERGLPEVKGLT